MSRQVIMLSVLLAGCSGKSALLLSSVTAVRDAQEQVVVTATVLCVADGPAECSSDADACIVAEWIDLPPPADQADGGTPGPPVVLHTRRSCLSEVLTAGAKESFVLHSEPLARTPMVLLVKVESAADAHLAVELQSLRADLRQSP